ncbi:uncharacterized protein LOC114946050 [Nylanderia fulva]|uniref:uncharacterized protein LOC114946050 n=1 Tax=Nylanderia fulva TaxID=613905 RepID=UPI0010FB3B4D|nr:uncharacterized protein LOC114946050 [Nylanderia fulva]
MLSGLPRVESEENKNIYIYFCKMNMYWNMLYLERPPYATWSIKSLSAKEADINVDLCKYVLNTTIKDLESMDILHAEATALSRLIYRMKNKFRSDKGLRCMVALNKALINYYNMSLLKEYKDLQSVIEIEDEIHILPSKQMLEYVLVRTQGFAKLMAKVEDIARHSAHFLKARINLGHAWNIALIAYATVSRIWFCSKLILQKSCGWYNNLYSCSKNFEYVGLPWIPKSQSLPSNLRLWLSLDWLNAETNMSDSTKQHTFEQFMPEVSDNTNFNTSESRLQANASTHNVLLDVESDSDDTNDIGEVIARETFGRSLLNVQSNTPLPRKRKHMHTTNQGETTGKRVK